MADFAILMINKLSMQVVVNIYKVTSYTASKYKA